MTLLDLQSEKILKYLIELDKLQPNMWVATEVICSVFSTVNESVIVDIIENLKSNGFADAFLSDNGMGDVRISHAGRVYFETKAMELAKQQPQSVTINNSSNFNVGNNNTINVTEGLTADEALRLIEQSTLSDKEALKEVILLLNDALENNKPIQPSMFQRVLSGVTSVAQLIQAIGGIVMSKMSGNF